MWVQVHNLPIGISSSAAKNIVSVEGKVLENSPNKEVYEGSNFVRVRVGIDITKSLCRGRKLTLRDGCQGPFFVCDKGRDCRDEPKTPPWVRQIR